MNDVIPKSMKNITLYIPDGYDVFLKDMIHDKVVDSRSDAIRKALNIFLRKDISFFNKLERCNDAREVIIEED